MVALVTFDTTDADGSGEVDTLARYHARYDRQDRIFRRFDRLLGVVVRRSSGTTGTLERAPRRLLLVNAGHLGDVIISTALLPVLHHAFPGVEVGFLTGRYSRAVVEGHPLIAWTHFIDHWYQSRQAVPRWRRFASYAKALPQVARELRALRYDAAIDVRAWFPNLVPLLWMARIPVRVAYDRLGFGPLLTHSVRYNYEWRHELEYQLSLLRVLGVPPESVARAWPVLGPPSSQAVQEARCIVGEIGRYRILHPVSSTPTRDWPLEHWVTLARDLVKSGVTPVITGNGPRDAQVAAVISSATPGSINTVNRLSWQTLVAVIAASEAVYAVETSIGHVASALRRPVISLYGGMADPLHWAPVGAVVATNKLPCHPCINKHGCPGRECLTTLLPDDVKTAGQLALNRRDCIDSDGPRLHEFRV